MATSDTLQLAECVASGGPPIYIHIPERGGGVLQYALMYLHAHYTRSKSFTVPNGCNVTSGCRCIHYDTVSALGDFQEKLTSGRAAPERSSRIHAQAEHA